MADRDLKKLIAKHDLHAMATVGRKTIYIGDIAKIRSAIDYDVIKAHFFVYRHDYGGNMERERWRKAIDSRMHNIIMTPVQWESFRLWADDFNDWSFVGEVRDCKVDDWCNDPPLYLHHPQFRSKNGYHEAVSFGILKPEVRKEGKVPWAWSDSLCEADYAEGRKHRPLSSLRYMCIYDRQPDGRFKLRTPIGRSKTMTEKTIQSTTTLLKQAAKKGGAIEAADRVNQILCDKGVKKMLVKMGFSKEFLKTEAGDLVVRWLAPIVINEMCARTNLIPKAEFVSVACGEAMTANTIHTLRPLINKAMPMLTALAEVGKEIAEETKEKAESNVEEPAQPAVQ